MKPDLSFLSFLLGTFKTTNKVYFVTVAIPSLPKELLHKSKFRADKKKERRKNKFILKAFLYGNNQELAPAPQLHWPYSLSLTKENSAE